MSDWKYVNNKKNFIGFIPKKHNNAKKRNLLVGLKKKVTGILELCQWTLKKVKRSIFFYNYLNKMNYNQYFSEYASKKF